MATKMNVLPAAVNRSVSAGLTKAPMNPLLAAYLAQLAARPLITKMCTSGTLSFFQEILASKIAGGRPPVHKTGVAPVDLLQKIGVDKKVLKLACYGAFAGKTSPKAKVGQIVASNVLVAPIQNTAFLIAMAVIGGAESTDKIIAFWKRSFLPIMKVSWVAGPLSMAFAQKYLAPETWVPFFNAISFVLGTYLNTKSKKLQLAMKRDAERSEKGPRRRY